MFYPLNWVKCNDNGKNICSWIYAPPSCCRIYSVALLKIYTCMSVCENTTKQLVQTSIWSWCWGRWQTLCAALFMLQRGKRVWAHAEYLKENKDSFFLELIHHRHNLSTKSCVWPAYLLLSHCAGLNTAKPLWKKPLHIVNCCLMWSRCYIIISLPTI